MVPPVARQIQADITTIGVMFVGNSLSSWEIWKCERSYVLLYYSILNARSTVSIGGRHFKSRFLDICSQLPGCAYCYQEIRALVKTWYGTIKIRAYQLSQVLENTRMYLEGVSWCMYKSRDLPPLKQRQPDSWDHGTIELCIPLIGMVSYYHWLQFREQNIGVVACVP